MMQDRGSIFSVLLILICPFVHQAWGQSVAVYEPIPGDKITASASSSFPGFDVSATINGDGMEHNRHVSHNLGEHMWISRISTTAVQAHPRTRKGVVWAMYTFDAPKTVDLIEIWNHNQHNHLNRGLQKVYLQYSSDGEQWHTLHDGNDEFFILPKSKGEHHAPPTFRLNLSGLTFKYFCITADTATGNYYHDGNPRTLENAAIANQNIDYYGLSEIRFYRNTKKNVSELPVVTNTTYTVSQGYRKTPDGPAREFTVGFNAPLYAGGQITVQVDDRKVTQTIPASEMGIYEVALQFPSGMMPEASRVVFDFKSSQGNVSNVQHVPGARAWKIYFLPHSHLDIGYTHRHEDVMELQLRNIELAMELIEQSRDLPEASQFRWNIETMWPLVEYKKRYDGSERWLHFKRAVQSGHIGLNASLGNILTGLCKQEELMHLFDDGIAIGRSLGVDVNSVMMSDVPGFSWGTVTAMAENGLKYFSMAPNFVPHLLNGGSRVGLSHIEWADRPFYWQSQSGEEQVLCWSAGTGYSFFHDWLAGPLSSAGLNPIWERLAKLEAQAFPYSMTYFRYTVNGDNGPPDDEMASLIAEWNKTYASPQFVIGTTEQLFTEFEEKYKDHIPAYKGDFTPYWEDGAASTASTLSMNRRNADRLNQLEILWSMIAPDKYPSDAFHEAWRNVVLFSEHTWGASASGPAPEAPLTRALWKQKENFARTADSIRTTIAEDAAVLLGTGGKRARYIQVFNTNLWSRTDVVTVTTNSDLHGVTLLDESGEVVPLQRFGSNEWIFVAKDVPPLSSRAYRVVYGKRRAPERDTHLKITENEIENGHVSVQLNPRTGAITKLVSTRTGKNFAAGEGLNTFVYTGRNAADPVMNTAVEKILPVRNGPVASTLRVISNPPGTHRLEQDVTLYEGIPRVDIRNVVDKTKSYEFENIRFEFPFDIANAETEIDLAFGRVRPEREQLSGANKNFYSVNNGVAITGLKHSVLLTTVDTPILELGEMTGEAWMSDRRTFLDWKRQGTSSPTVFSWAMNNSWRTNYKASQEGEAVFQYSVIPLGSDAPDAKLKGLEIAQPLRAFVSQSDEVVETLFQLRGNHQIAVSTLRPAKANDGYIVRLTNLSDRSVRTAFEAGSIKPAAIYECNNQEEVRGEINAETFWMKPYGTLTLKLLQ